MNLQADGQISAGVFYGYEPGTKGYRVYDPAKDKVMCLEMLCLMKRRHGIGGGGEMAAGWAVEKQ